jgi:CheY-like chemotaxis protein
MSHVLLIDDDDDVIQLNRMTLQAKGHEVSAAHSAQEGWDALAAARPDVVVLDVMMEEFNAGFTLAQDIAIKYPRLPMIMLTGVREHMSSAWRFTPGEDSAWIPVQRFMEKPVEPNQLLRAVEEVAAAVR